ncbi:hypothetical protein A0H81_11399 [Grifola frondosa]|uniref:Uncharacterized protein n=1 Tax=Grifola frondosa TaxID=5627 RepID=A0A1C7LVX5_GRIFR|nr:hypothetical protein A0H81_11399 [Grifola frondosa]
MADKAKATHEQLRCAKETISAALGEFVRDGVRRRIRVHRRGAVHSDIHMRGKLMLAGMGSRNVVLLSAAATREVAIHVIPLRIHVPALVLLASGKLLNTEKINMHRFALQDTARMFELFSEAVATTGI